jgi:hypothetical protein
MAKAPNPERLSAVGHFRFQMKFIKNNNPNGAIGHLSFFKVIFVAGRA